MELINRDKRDGYVYDPIIKQFDTTFWKATTGTPAMSSNVLRFTSAAVASYLQHIFADIEFDLTIPAAPTVGDVRSWGFRNPSSDDLGAVYFKIAGTAFTAEVVDSNGNATSTVLSWIAGYTATATKYRIRWENDHIIFYINGVIVATVATENTANNQIPENALAARIINGNADNMDLTYMAVRRAASII